MITASKNKAPAFPGAKIRRIVRSILPKGQRFRLQTEDSGIDQKRVVRVVTPAWKSLGNPERISKVLKAMQSQLSPMEQDRIFRFSVLTEEQYRDIVLNNPPARDGKAPVKRKAARKQKRTSVG